MHLPRVPIIGEKVVVDIDGKASVFTVIDVHFAEGGAEAWAQYQEPMAELESRFEWE